MKISRRVAWLLVILFCVVTWGLVAIAFAGEDKTYVPGIPPGKPHSPVDVEKIKRLDLNPQQRKFIESLIEAPPQKTGDD